MKIDMHNYEEFMLSLVDNELNEEETKALWLFLEQHPDLQHELKLLQAAKLPADEKVIFTDKNSLYRKENMVTPKIPFLRRYPWISVAAAACLLLLVALIIHPWKKQTLPKEIALNTLPVQKNPSPVSNPVNPPSKEIVHKQQEGQKEDLAAQQIKRNKVLPVHKIKEGKVLAQVQPPEISRPELPVEVPAISSNTNENNSIALQEKQLPGQLPLENITLVTQSNQANVSEESGQKNSGKLIAGNEQGRSEDIVQKVEEWKDKPSKILENIHQNGLKIGKITIAFNN